MARIWHINGRFLAQPVTGVQRYALEVIRALDRHLADGHPLARQLELQIIAPPGVERPAGLREIQFRTAGLHQAGIGGHLWEQAVLPRLARKGGGLLSLANTGPLSVRRQIVCIHDANTRTCPVSYSRAFRMLYRVLHPALGRRVARITTVSHYAAERLAEHGICPRERITVAANGYEHALRWIPSHSPATRAIAGPNTVVILGSPAPHKNIGLILGLAAELEEAGLRVAVTGVSDARVFSGLPRLPASRGIVWLGRLSDGELAALLRDSLCLAFPSLEEGFGLPALEAMALQCPAVVSNRASLPEVCGNAALYASPYDGEAWLDAFLRLRNDPRLRQQMIALGRLQAMRYRWWRTAETYLQEMARLDGLPTATPAVADRNEMAIAEHAA